MVTNIPSHYLVRHISASPPVVPHVLQQGGEPVHLLGHVGQVSYQVLHCAALPQLVSAEKIWWLC